MIVALLVACGSIVTHDTARIATNHAELKTSVVVSKNANTLLGVLPLPSVDLVHRRRLGPDADLGLKVLGGAPAIDVRKRMVRTERLDLTVASAATVSYLPTGGGAGLVGTGFVDFGTPVLATATLSRRHSLTFAAKPGLQWLTATSTGEGVVSEGLNRVIPQLGLGMRWEYTGDRRGLGVSADLLARPGEGAPTGWAISVQNLRFAHRARRRVFRAVRRSAREARR